MANSENTEINYKKYFTYSKDENSEINGTCLLCREKKRKNYKNEAGKYIRIEAAS